MVFYCERAIGSGVDVGLQDEGFFVALVRMFEQALQVLAKLPEAHRPVLMERLNLVHSLSRTIGYGVEDAMSDLLVEYGHLRLTPTFKVGSWPNPDFRPTRLWPHA